MGWSIGGLSTITRCPATMAQDGFSGGIHFNRDDRFCLDGQRLKVINGSYGDNGAEYRTEIETYSKIISYGSDGYGPEYFKVWTKSGQILEYGGNAQSDEGRIERFIVQYHFGYPAGTELKGVRLWALSKVTDRTQKYMEYDYAEENSNLSDSGEYWIDEIRYTGHSANGRPPYLKVKFIYSDTLRSPEDKISKHHEGERILSEKLLTEVRTCQNSCTDPPDIFNKYVVDYAAAVNPNTHRTLPANVRLCDAYNSCLPKTGFSYQITSDPQIRDTKNNCVFVLPGGTPNLSVTAGLSQGRGGFFKGLLDRLPSPTLRSRTLHYAEYDSEFTNNARLGADVNNDGRSDLIIISKNNSDRIIAAIFYYDKTSGGFVKDPVLSDLGPWDVVIQTNHFIEMDVTGDGHTDIVVLQYLGYAQNWNARVYRYTGNPSSRFELASTNVLDAGPLTAVFHTANLNGDNKADLISTKGSSGDTIREAFAFVSHGTYFSPYPASTNPYKLEHTLLTSFNPELIREFVADMNGDGLTDVVYVQPTGTDLDVDIFLATKPEAFKMQFIDTTPGYSNHIHLPGILGQFMGLDHFYIFPMDYNGDGINDLAFIALFGIAVPGEGKTSIQIYLGNGDGTNFEKRPFINAQILSDPNAGYQQFYPADLNGDGKTDLINFSHNTSQDPASN